MRQSNSHSKYLENTNTPAEYTLPLRLRGCVSHKHLKQNQYKHPGVLNVSGENSVTRGPRSGLEVTLRERRRKSCRQLDKETLLSSHRDNRWHSASSAAPRQQVHQPVPNFNSISALVCRYLFFPRSLISCPFWRSFLSQ